MHFGTLALVGWLAHCCSDQCWYIIQYACFIANGFYRRDSFRRTRLDTNTRHQHHATSCNTIVCWDTPVAHEVCINRYEWVRGGGGGEERGEGGDSCHEVLWNHIIIGIFTFIVTSISCAREHRKQHASLHARAWFVYGKQTDDRARAHVCICVHLENRTRAEERKLKVHCV